MRSSRGLTHEDSGCYLCVDVRLIITSDSLAERPPVCSGNPSVSTGVFFLEATHQWFINYQLVLDLFLNSLAAARTFMYSVSKYIMACDDDTFYCRRRKSAKQYQPREWEAGLEHNRDELFDLIFLRAHTVALKCIYITAVGRHLYFRLRQWY